MLRRSGSVAVLAVLAAMLPTSAFAGGYNDGMQSAAPAPATSASASGDGIAVTVSQSGSTSTGRTFTSSSVARVSPLCWYGRGMSGYAYFEYWKPDGTARQSGTLDAYAAQGLLNPGYEAHATDTEGHWYEATCRTDAPADYVLDYLRAHPPVWVPPSAPAPATHVAVDPAALAKVASDAIDLPQGTIRWNPMLQGSKATVVNVDTWIWVEDAPTTVTVRAEIPGAWAQVDAVLSGLEVSAPGATTAHCPDTGTPWTEGATSTDCKITFRHSSADEPLKPGQSHRTATLTARATWTASWTSSTDSTPTPLPAQVITTTAEIPVAEVQTIVTG